MGRLSDVECVDCSYWPWDPSCCRLLSSQGTTTTCWVLPMTLLTPPPPPIMMTSCSTAPPLINSSPTALHPLLLLLKEVFCCMPRDVLERITHWGPSAVPSVRRGSSGVITCRTTRGCIQGRSLLCVPCVVKVLLRGLTGTCTSISVWLLLQVSTVVICPWDDISSCYDAKTYKELVGDYKSTAFELDILKDW